MEIVFLNFFSVVFLVHHPFPFFLSMFQELVLILIHGYFPGFFPASAFSFPPPYLISNSLYVHL